MQLALVTGGAGGIGAAVVRRLHSDGFSVLFTHLGQSEEAASLCAELGDDVTSVESDTSDEAAVIALHQGIDPSVLVHCAGIARDRPIWKQEIEDFDMVHAVNLRGAWLQARESCKAMRSNSWGRIILIGSINGTRGKFGQSAYSSSKSALHGLTKSLAKELGNKKITVNLIEPGWIETPMTASIPAEYRDAAIAESLNGRLGTPVDIAASVSFLVSEGASHITGNILRVDGGQHL